MKRNYFTHRQCHQSLGWLLLMFLMLLPGLEAYGDTFEYDGLTVTTDGVEGTDYKKEDRSFRILTDKDFTFSASSTVVRIVVDGGVQNARFTLSGYNCDRGEGWIGGPIIIGKNSSTTITLAEGTVNTIRGSYETETMLIDDGASVTITGKGSLTANSSREVCAGHGAAIQLNKTATLTIESGTITAVSDACGTGEGAAIGGRQYGDVENCGTLIVNGGTVTLSANNAAAFGGGTGCTYPTVNNPAGRPGGTLIVNGGKLIANGRIGGGTSINGETGVGGAGGSITINGGEVTSTMDLGSAPNAESCGSINLVGGTLSTPSVEMENGTVTIKQSMTLADNLTTTLPVSVNAGVLLTLAENVTLNIDKSQFTLADGAKIYNPNVPSLNADKYYEINTVAQLKWFRDLVNGNLIDGTEQNVSANAILMADLDLQYEPWQSIGNYTEWHDVKYHGIFDGNYHTISNLKITKTDFHAGLFGTAFGCTIKNLGVINANISGVQYAGSVIAGLVMSSTVENCYSAGTLEFSDCGQASGIATSQHGSSFINCYTSYSNLSYEDCSITNSQAGLSSDCYKTGELAYLLNTNKADDETCSWGQTIGMDAHPVALVDGINNVYQFAQVQEDKDLTLGTTDATGRMTTLCFPREVSLPEKVTAFTVTGMDASNIEISQLGTNVVPGYTPVILLNTGTEEATVSLPSTNAAFSNSTAAIVSQSGNLLKGTYRDLTSITETQYCLDLSSFSRTPTNISAAYQCYLEYASGAETYTPVIAEYLDYPSLNSDNYYEIYNVAQMKWFAGLVRGTLVDGTEKNLAANGKLMADLDLKNEPWAPMADWSPWYEGPGQIYSGTFDGNYHTISNLNVKEGYSRGFFGRSMGTIKNLGVVNAIVSPGEGWVGVIAADVWHATIMNCWTAGDIVLADGNKCEGVAGVANVDECASAKNCHTSYSAVAGKISSNRAGLDNCSAGLPSDAYKTGELAYLLNTNKMSDETCSWGQTIGTDVHPVALVEGSNNVYKYGEAKDATTFEIKADYQHNRLTTLCFPNEVTLPEKVMAFTVTRVDENSSDNWCANIVMSKIEANVVPANTPVILMNTGTETATVSLPAITGYYSNSATASDIISNEGNLLKGTYSQLNLSNTQYNLNYGMFFREGEALPAYQSYLEAENGKDYYSLETSEPVGEIDYAVLSEDDKTCYVSRVFYAGIGTSNYELTIPSTTQIDGVDYDVMQLGLCTDDDADRVRFVSMNGSSNAAFYINLPKTIKTVSKEALSNLSLGGMMEMMGGASLVRFSTEEVPEFKGTNSEGYYWCRIDVPYAAENAYKAAWGEKEYIDVSSRKTEVDIANGDIEVFGNRYAQGATVNEIDGTLVIKGTSTENSVLVEDGGTAEEPLRIAINGLNIDMTGLEYELPSMDVGSGANVSLIVQGENTLASKESISSIFINEGGSLAINSLSTGTLNVSGGVFGDNVTVAAKVYKGSSASTMQNVTKETVLDTENNELAVSDYSLVSGIDNLVANGACENFVLNDGVDVYLPSAFKASHVTYKRTFTDNDFNSLYLPFSASVDDFEDCEFYVINMFHQNDTDGDGVFDNITLEVSKAPAGSILLANHPYLFKYKGINLNEAVEFNLKNIDVVATESNAFECASMSYKYEFTGYHQGKTADDFADYYVIGVDNETGKTALVHPTKDLPAMRWAMKMTARESQLGTASVSAPARMKIVVTGEDSATGIRSVNATDDSNAFIYDINGVRKSQMTKGINIVKTADGKVIKVVK